MLNLRISLGDRGIMAGPLPYESPDSAVLGKKREHVLLARAPGILIPLPLSRFNLN
jgi:hypothetical protein